MGLFERYLSLWVAACIALGLLFGTGLSTVVRAYCHAGIRAQVNFVVALLIWLMIYPHDGAKNRLCRCVLKT